MNKIIVLHGWTYSKDKWTQLVAFLKKKNINIELLDIPGLTDSTDKAWTLEDYVAWLDNMLKQYPDVTLIGHSNGGRIALAYSAKYPNRINKLILIDSAGIYPKGLKISLKRNIFKTVAHIGKKLTSSDKLRSLLYKLAREGDYKNASPIMRQTMSNLISIDLTPILPNIATPTSIIWGSDDKVTPLKDGRLMHKLIPNSKLYIIKDARHSPQTTHYQEVGKHILEIIKNENI